jgi:GTP-binding protein LepA
LKARQLVDKLREVVKRDLFEIRIQVLVNGKPAARETLKALRKDVTAKLVCSDYYSIHYYL